MDLTPIGLPTPSGTPLAFADYRGRRAVLVLGNQQNAELVPGIALQLQGTPATAEVPVIQVAHLVGVPRMVHKFAERTVRLGLEKQRAALREERQARGRSADDVDSLVVVGLDWAGVVTGPLGFTSTHDRPMVAVIGEDGVVGATVDDPEPLAALVALLGT